MHLIVRARDLYAKEPLEIDLEATVYALNATTIELGLSLFDWAPFRWAKAAVKMHTLLDLRGASPALIQISDRTAFRCLALHFATDIVDVHFREVPANMRLAARCQRNYRITGQQPIDVVRLITGHYWWQLSFHERWAGAHCGKPGARCHTKA